MPDSNEGDGGNPPPEGAGRRWHTREDSGLRLDRDGRWWHDGVLVEHPKIIEAFNLGLKPTEDGRFRLDFGWDWCFVEVEDAAYRVVAIDSGDEGVTLRLSDRSSEACDPAHLAIDDEGVLSVRVKEGRAKARFSRDAQFALGSLIERVEGRSMLRVGSRLLPLPHHLNAAIQ